MQCRNGFGHLFDWRICWSFSKASWLEARQNSVSDNASKSIIAWTYFNIKELDPKSNNGRCSKAAAMAINVLGEKNTMRSQYGTIVVLWDWRMCMNNLWSVNCINGHLWIITAIFYRYSPNLSQSFMLSLGKLLL